MALAAYNLSQPGSSTLSAPFCVVTSLPPAIETPEVVRMATRLRRCVEPGLRSGLGSEERV